MQNPDEAISCYGEARNGFLRPGFGGEGLKSCRLAYAERRLRPTMRINIHPFSVFARRDLHNPDEAISCYLGIMGQSIRTLLKDSGFLVFYSTNTPFGSSRSASSCG